MYKFLKAATIVVPANRGRFPLCLDLLYSADKALNTYPPLIISLPLVAGRFFLLFQFACYIFHNCRIVFRHLAADNVNAIVVGTSENTTLQSAL